MFIRSIQIPSFPQVDLNHSEQLLNALSDATLNPIRQIAFYFFPALGNFCSYHMEVRSSDPAQESMIPSSNKRSIFREIDKLVKAAKLKRPVTLYTAMSHHFSSFGGPLSLSKPTLTIPYSALMAPWAENPTEEPYNLWKQSDLEKRFFIAREIVRIKTPTFLIHVAGKISFLFLFRFFPIPCVNLLTRGLLLTISAIAFHCFLERKIQKKMDIQAVEILSRHLGDSHLAHKVAVNALNKIREQNLYRLQYNKLCRLYVTPKGDNLLDLTHARLLERIRVLSSYRKD